MSKFGTTAVNESGRPLFKCDAQIGCQHGRGTPGPAGYKVGHIVNHDDAPYTFSSKPKSNRVSKAASRASKAMSRRQTKTGSKGSVCRSSKPKASLCRS